MDSLLPKSKVCNKCGGKKLLEEFDKQAKGKYGKRATCKLCRKQHYEANKEKFAEKSKQYYQENKKSIKEYHKQYCQDNKEKLAEKSKQYYQDNKEQISEKAKQYREANKEKKAEYHKRYYDKNKEQIIKKNKQYAQDNKERTNERARNRRKNDEQFRLRTSLSSDLCTVYESYAAYRICHRCGEEKSLQEFYNRKNRKGGYVCKLCAKQHSEKNKEETAKKNKQYYQDNKEHLNERKRNRLKNDEPFRIRYYLSNALYQSLKAAKTTKKNRTLTYIGCSIEFMQEHLNSTKKPDWGDDLHIDHIIPSSLFDHTNEEEVKKCWNWRNLRYLPAKENISKQDTLDMDLVKSYGIEDLLPLEQKLRDGN